MVSLYIIDWIDAIVCFTFIQQSFSCMWAYIDQYPDFAGAEQNEQEEQKVLAEDPVLSDSLARE
jgi:hypothetical protein